MQKTNDPKTHLLAIPPKIDDFFLGAHRLSLSVQMNTHKTIGKSINKVPFTQVDEKKPTYMYTQ